MMRRMPAPATGAERTAIVLGIDPGLQRTGYALVAVQPSSYESSRLVEAGIIRLERGAPLPDRLLELDHGLAALLTEHRPALLACEELYAHYRHPRTAILMGHARGVVLAAAARAGVVVTAVPATQAKKLLPGSGHATKTQMQRAVQTTLRLPALPEPHDVADAIAIALCGVRLHLAGVLTAAAEGDRG